MKFVSLDCLKDVNSMISRINFMIMERHQSQKLSPTLYNFVVTTWCAAKCKLNFQKDFQISKSRNKFKKEIEKDRREKRDKVTKCRTGR